MKYLISTLLIVLSLNISARTLSGDAEISILTCSPGNELYSLFGHTAIRVTDPQQNMDIVFNYGTFDFDTPNFYLKYAQGLLPYQLSITSYSHFLRSYQYEQRSVYSQTLQLDSIQKQRLFGLLEENYQPENRYYLYNFLFDNCTSRARDVVQKALPNTIEWNIADADKSFWNLLDEYLSASPWVKWGIHTILGHGGNKTATPYQYMFLPDYLMYGLTKAQYNGQLLASETEIMYEAPERELNLAWYKTPFFIFAIGVFILILLMQQYRNVALLNFISIIFFLFSGIVGVIVTFLGLFTEHPITFPNWNILWANPLNLVAIPFIILKRIPRFVHIYLKIYMILLVIAIPTWIITQPAVPMASLFIIIFMIYLCLRLRRKQIKNKL